MSIGARDLWGYDPGVLLRYAEWMYASQGRDPDDCQPGIGFRHPAAQLRDAVALPVRPRPQNKCPG